MSIWKTLEIEECRDKNIITNAYREKLLVTNPEDSPEAFKKLRGAYEEALRFAGQPENEETEEIIDSSPEGQFVQAAEKLYDNFTDRLNLEKWKRLLASDICHALDTKIEIRNRLLKMLMTRYRLPRPVWQLFDETFSLREDQSDLSELFPADFIEHAVVYGIENNPNVPYDLFDGDDDAEFDRFISYYYSAVRAVDERKMDDAREILTDMKELDIYHPYMDILEIRIMLIGQEFTEARLKAEMLYDQYPDDLAVKLYMGETAFYTENLEVARKFYKQVLEVESESFLPLYGLASCLKKEEKFEEAKEEFFAMLKIYPNSNNLLHEISEINDRLIDIYSKKSEAGDITAEELHNMGWACLQENKIEECKGFVSNLEPVHSDRFSYLNLCGRLYLADHDYEKALDYFRRWEESTIGLEDDGSKEVKKELGRRELPVFLQSVALMDMDQPEEALACVDRSLAIKEDTTALLHKANIFFQQKKYQETIEICDRLKSIAPEFWNQYVLLGKSQYELGNHSEAFRSFDEALRYYAYSLEPYIYKIRIYIEHEQYDQAQEIVDFLVAEGVESDRLMVCSAQLMEEKDDPQLKEKAQAIYREVILRCQKDESDMDLKHQVCYLLAVSMQNEKDLSAVLPYIDQGLKFQPDFVQLMDFKAYMFKKHEEPAKAEECYLAILEINPNHYNANDRLGNIHLEKKRYSEALACFERLAKIRKSAYTCEMIGRTCLESGKFAEALKYFTEAIDLNPQESGNYHYASVACMCLNDLNRAIEYGKQTVNIMQETDDSFVNANRLLAQNYTRLGNHTQALNAMYQNKELFGKEEDLKIMYTYMRAGDYHNAWAMLKQWYQVTEDQDKERIWLTEMAHLHFYMGTWKEGYKILKKMQNKTSTHFISLWGYFAMLNKWSKAIDNAKQYITMYPQDNFGYYLLAKAAYYKGDKNLAITNARKSLEFLKQNENEVDNRAYWACQEAKCLVILGDFEGFKKAIETARKSHLCLSCYGSGCYEVHEALAFYFEAVGDKFNAQKEFNLALQMCKNRYLLLLEAESLKKRIK